MKNKSLELGNMGPLSQPWAKKSFSLFSLQYNTESQKRINDGERNKSD